jgi:hypothetical protein
MDFADPHAPPGPLAIEKSCSSSPCMVTKSNKLQGASGTKETSTSTSLSGRKSSGIMDPNKAISRTFQRWQDFVICCGRSFIWVWMFFGFRKALSKWVHLTSLQVINLDSHKPIITCIEGAWGELQVVFSRHTPVATIRRSAGGFHSHHHPFVQILRHAALPGPGGQSRSADLAAQFI